MLNFAFLVIGGWVFVYLAQLFPLIKNMQQPFFQELLHCNLCFGFWVYFCLIAFFRAFPSELTYVPLVSEILMAACLSFTMHLLSLGWQTRFGVLE